MSISDIINGTQGANATSGTKGTKPKDQLGQAEFLELMIAQLKNQDPFKAMDPSQFLGQLAQFGTVSGIQEMQSAFATLSDSMRASQVLDGATMVGRDVLVASETVGLTAEGTVRGAIDVPAESTEVQIKITDASGQLVRTMTLPDGEGLVEFAWDGIGADGSRAPAGEYTLEAVSNVGGAAYSLETLMSSRVSSVTIDGARGLTLNTTTLGARALSDVRRVM
jgi:flagellar basal-body rod modification protein FlgD